MKSGSFRLIVMGSLIVAGLSLPAISAAADKDGAGLGIGLRYSTLGGGVVIGKSLGKNFSVRVGLNSFSEGATEEIDGIQYDADLDLSSTSLMFDWYPFGGSFHFTAGYVNSDNELIGQATPTGSVNIGGEIVVPVTAGDLVLDGNIQIGSGPFVGLGFGNVPEKGFGLVLEAGVIRSGAPDISLEVSGDAMLIAAIDQADIDAEIAAMQGDLEEFDIFPVIAVGFSYGF